MNADDEEHSNKLYHSGEEEKARILLPVQTVLFLVLYFHKKPYNKYFINLIRLVITGKSQNSALVFKASVWDFPVITSLSVY